MTHYAVVNRPIISSILKLRDIIFLIKRREILNLAVEFTVRFYLPTKIDY